MTAAVTGLAGSPVSFTASVVAAAASQIAKSSGDAQTATVNTLLPQPITVVVKDTYGNVKSGVTVNWAAVAGGGSTAVASSITDATGIATSGWTIGTVAGAGSQSATAAAAGLTGSPLTFTASATAGPAAVLAIVSGDNQNATVGNPLPAPLVASVKDAYNNPVARSNVTWAAATGGGSVSAATVATSAAGTASVTRTLGATVSADDHRLGGGDDACLGHVQRHRRGTGECLQHHAALPDIDFAGAAGGDGSRRRSVVRHHHG